MAHRLLIHSRRGNFVFGVLGTMYVLTALTLMGVLVYSTQAVQSATEVTIEGLLVGCAMAGLWFAATSARNLRHH